jgi:hypothetical protein
MEEERLGFAVLGCGFKGGEKVGAEVGEGRTTGRSMPPA